MLATAFRPDPIPQLGPYETTMDVEDALSWVYRHELPKLREDGGVWISSAVHPMWRAGVFGSRIDNWNREPGYPSSMGAPHEDALALADAVKALRDPQWREWVAWPTFDQGLEGFGIECSGIIAKASASIEALVMSRAKLRTRPELPHRMTVEPVLGSNNRPTIRRPSQIERRTLTGRYIEQTETTIEDTRKARGRAGVYPTGSYCGLQYWPRPETVLFDRAEYLAWWLALAWVAEEVAGRLSSTIITLPGAPMQPWLDDVGI